MTIDERSPIVEHRALRDHFCVADAMTDDIRAQIAAPPRGAWVELARATEAEDARLARVDREERDLLDSPACAAAQWKTRMQTQRRDRAFEDGRTYYDDRGFG